MSLLNILFLGLYILKASGISQISTTQYPPSVQNSVQQFREPNEISTLVVSAPKIKIKTTSENKPLDKAKKLVKNAKIIKPKRVKSRFNKNNNDEEDRQNFTTYNVTNYYNNSFYPYRRTRSINILTQGKNSTTTTNNKDYVQSPILLSAITPIIVDYLPNNQTEPPLRKSQTIDIISSHINPIEEPIEIEGVIRLNPITPIIMAGEQMVNTKSFDKLNQTAGGAAKIVKDDYLDDNDESDDKYTEPSYELSTPNIYQQKNVNDDADQFMSQMTQRKSRIFFNDVVLPPKNDKKEIDIQGYDKSIIESVEKESYQIFEDASKHKSLESLSNESWTNESLINETLLSHDNIETQEKVLKPFHHTPTSDYLGNDKSINKGIKTKKVNVIENFYNRTIEEISHFSSNYTIDMPISFDENSFSSEHQKNKIIGIKSQNMMVKSTYEQENDNKTEITEFNEKLKLHLDTTSAASQLFITDNPRIKTEYDNISIAQTHVGQFVDDNKTYDKNRSIIYDNYMLSLKQLSERIDETQESEEVIKTMINLEDETNVENDNALKDISKTTAFYQTFRPTTTSYSFDTPKEIWVTWSQGSVRLEEYLLNETESNQTNAPKSVDVKGKKSYKVDSSSIIKQIETEETEQTTEEEFLHVKKHHNDVKDVSETKTFLYHNKSSVIIESDNEDDYNIKTIRHKSNDTHDKFTSQQTMQIPEFKPTIIPIYNFIIKDDNSKNIGETSKGFNNQKISGVKDTVQHNEQLTEKTIEQISYVEANEKNENYFKNSRNKSTFLVENNKNISVNDRIQQLNNATTRHSPKNLTIPDVSSNVTMSNENGYYNMEQQDVKSIKTDLGIVNKTHNWMDVKFNNENVNDYANKQQNYYGTNSSFVHTKNTTSNNYTFETKNEVNDETINKNIVYFKTQYDNTKHDVVQLKNKTLATTDVTENQKMVAVDNVLLHQDLTTRQKLSEKKKDKKIKDKIPKQKTTEKPIKVHFGKTHVSNKQVVDVDEVKTDINVLKSISSSDMEASIKQPPNSEPIDIIQKTFDNPKYKGKEWHYVGKDLDLKISQTEYVDDKTYSLPTNVETNTVRIVQNNKLGIEFDNIRESDITTIHDTQIVAPTIDDDSAIIKTVFTGIDDEGEETKFQNLKETSFSVESTNKPTKLDYKDYNPILSHSIHTPLANKQFSAINKPGKQSESDFGIHHEMPRGDIADAVEVDENIKLLSIHQTSDDSHNKFKQNNDLKESSTQQTKINQHSKQKYEMIDDQKTYLPQRGDKDQHSNTDKTILFSQSNSRNVMDRGPSSLHAIKLIKVDRFTQSDGTEVEVKTYSGIGENGERITYTQTSKRKTVIQKMPSVITYDLDRKVISGVGQTFNEKIGKMSQSINSKSAQSNYDTANYYETKHDKQHDKIKKLHNQKLKKVQGDVILLQTPRDESLVLREKSYKLQNILNTPKTGVHNHYRYYKEDGNTYHNTGQQLNNYPPSQINSNIQNHYAIENTGDNVRTYIVHSAKPQHQRISNTNTKDYNYRALSHSPPHKLKNQSPSSSRSQNLRHESDQYNRGTYYNINHQNNKFNPVLNHHGQTENQRINKYNFEIDDYNPYGPQSRPQPQLFAVPENFDPIIMHEPSFHKPSPHNYPVRMFETSSFVNNAHAHKKLRHSTFESDQPQMVGQQASRKRNKRYLNNEEHEDTHHYGNRHMPDYPVHTFGVGERVEYEEEGRRFFHRPTRVPYKTMSPVKRTTLKVTTSSQPKYETKKARYYKTTPYHKIPKAKVTHSPQIGTTGSAFTTQNVLFKQKGLKGFSCGKTKLKIDFSSSEENSSNEERILPKVVGGEEAVAGSWPWIVLLKYLGELACGGTIIGPNHVLTATHCFPNYIEAWNFTITAGIHIKESVGLPLEQIRRIKKLTKHIHFDRDNKYDNDIALIEVDKPFIFGDYVQPICLPEQNETVPVGTICCIAGFGETRGSSQDTALNELCLPMMSTKTCNSTEYYNGRLTSTMICAGFEEGQKDACKGDTGGPLTCEIEGIHKLIGVVSWGQGCAREKKPGIYTNVALFNKWINENL